MFPGLVIWVGPFFVELKPETPLHQTRWQTSPSFSSSFCSCCYGLKWKKLTIFIILLYITSNAVCISDLDKLRLIWRFDFRLNPIFATATAASKNTTSFKNSQKYPKRIISLLLSRFSLNPWYTLQFNTNMTLNVFYFINIVNYVTVPSPEVNPSKLCFYSSSDSCC